MEVEIIGPIVEGADVVKAVAAVVAAVGVFETIVDAVAVGLGIGPLNRLKVKGSVIIRKCLLFYLKISKNNSKGC